MKHKQKKSRFIKQIIFFLSIALLLVILTPTFSTNYQEALTAVQRNDLDKAQVLLNQTLARNPNDLNSKALYAIVTYRQGNFEEAETHLLELSSSDQLSKNDSILYMLADVQNTLGFKQEALQTIVTAYEVNPDNLSIQQLYTTIYYDLSDAYAEASATSQTELQVQVNPVQSSQPVIQDAVVSSRARDVNPITLQAPTAGTIQNALNIAVQGTTLVPETTEAVNNETITDSTIVSSTVNSSVSSTSTATTLDKPYTFEEAAESYAANKFNLARAQLENILAGNPHHIEATKMLAGLAYRDGNIEQSVELYTRLTQTPQFIQNPQADVHYGLALAQRGMGDLEGAFSNAAQAILQDPDHEAINRLYNSLSTDLATQDSAQDATISYTFEDALAAYKENDIELARLQLQHIVETDPNNTEAITMLAYIVYRDGNSEQAAAMFQSLVNQADFNENSDVLYGLALAQRNVGNLNEALASAQRAQVAAPDREDVQNLVNSLSATVQAEREKALITAANSQNQQPSLSFSFEDALEAYKANDIETAQARFEALVAANPDDTDSAILLAYIIYRTDSHKAVEMFTALTERADFDENSDVLYGLALSHRNSGDLEAAFTSIERAYVAAPEREDVADLYTKLFNALEEAKVQEAQELVAAANEANALEDATTEESTIEETPVTVENSLPYSFEDAMTAYKANDIETARAQFEGLVAANSDDTDSATLLAYIVYRSDAEQAATMFQNIVNRPDFNENSDVLYGLALSQRNAGNMNAAFTAVERAYIAAPDREDVTELYAQIYAALNAVADGG